MAEIPDLPSWIRYRCTVCGTTKLVDHGQATMMGQEHAAQVAGAIIYPLFNPSLLEGCESCDDYTEHTPDYPLDQSSD